MLKISVSDFPPASPSYFASASPNLRRCPQMSADTSGTSFVTTGSDDSKFSVRLPPTENLDISSSGSGSEEEASLEISAYSLNGHQSWK